jgi:hypothetical protein
MVQKSAVNTPKQNAPLNFRTSNSLTTTKVPHYATKVDTANSSVPGLHRPNTNGVPSNINQHDFQGPEFKARPMKHWRRQHIPTSVANAMDAETGVITNPEAYVASSSSGRRTATVGLLMDRPGAVSYLGSNSDCKCVEPGGNSYTISEHFTSTPKASGTIVENQGSIRIGQGGDAYEINTGIYSTKCISCNPQNNVIRSASTLLSRAYYSDTTGYLKSRCKTYQQNASINRSANVQYTDTNEKLLWPTASATGPQVYRTNDTYQPRVNPYTCNNTGGASTVIFKPNNRQYSVQGAVDSSTRIEKLKLNTINTNANSLRSAFGNEAASACRFTGSSDTPFFLKNKYQPPICSQTNTVSIYRQNKRICSL